MNYFTSYIYLIFAVKIIFIILASTNLYLKIKKSKNTALQQKILYWKGRLEFLFVFLMSLLLIYLFNPRINRQNMINSETKLLFYLFGFVLLITADWSNFIHEAEWFQRFQEILSSR
jgi:hypothetical protein